METIRVRVRPGRGHLRLQNVQDGKFVQCPRSWRQQLPAGKALHIQARLRSDGECWVAAPQVAGAAQ